MLPRDGARQALPGSTGGEGKEKGNDRERTMDRRDDSGRVQGGGREYQSIAYIYGHADQRDAETAKGLNLDEARRLASNIAKLPDLLRNRLN
jgi:hypothetical protein